MKQNELKFKYGDTVRVKFSDTPIMTVKDYELALTEEIKNAVKDVPTVNVPDNEPEYTGKVNLYWISNGKRQTRLISQDMLELAEIDRP